MNPTPTLTQLYEDLRADFLNKLNINDSENTPAINAHSSVLAAQLRMLYLSVLDVRRNLFPDTADLAADGGDLERIGKIYLKRLPRPATSGLYKVAISGSVGSILRASLTFKSNQNSNSPDNLYILDSEFILSSENDFIELRSLNTGLDFILDVGNQLEITEPVLGVNQVSVVSEVITRPVSEENIDVYRKSIEYAIQQEAQGGSKTDYRLWASDVQGVISVYPYVKQGDSGTVQIFVESVKIDSIDGNGTPSQSMLNQVSEVLEFDPDESEILDNRGRRPMQAYLEVLPITLIPVDVEITGLTNQSEEIKNKIKENLSIFLSSIRPFIYGADLLRNKNDILLSARLQNEVANVIGNSEYFNNFKTLVNGNEVNSYTFSFSNIPYFRNLITN